MLFDSTVTFESEGWPSKNFRSAVYQGTDGSGVESSLTGQQSPPTLSVSKGALKRQALSNLLAVSSGVSTSLSHPVSILLSLDFSFFGGCREPNKTE